MWLIWAVVVIVSIITSIITSLLRPVQGGPRVVKLDKFHCNTIVSTVLTSNIISLIIINIA